MEETNTLEKLLKETDYSTTEWAFRKVEKNNQLQDLKNTLDEMPGREAITQEQYNFAIENVLEEAN